MRASLARLRHNPRRAVPRTEGVTQGAFNRLLYQLGLPASSRHAATRRNRDRRRKRSSRAEVYARVTTQTPNVAGGGTATDGQLLGRSSSAGLEAGSTRSYRPSGGQHATTGLPRSPTASGDSACVDGEADEVQRNWNRWDWAAGYSACEEEPEGYWLEVEGQLPLELEGTYFRNGPGRLDLGSRERVAHPFDADGLVMSVSISKGKAFFRSKFVETSEREIEDREGRRVFRGSFGTQLTGGFWRNFLELAPRNAANTSVVYWAGRCLALFEAGQPYSLDPRTLKTTGMDLLCGVLKAGLPFSTGRDFLDGAVAELLDSFGVSSALPEGVALGGDAFSAHPHVCDSTGRLVTFSYSIRLKRHGPLGLLPGLETVITFYELNTSMNVVSSMDYVLDGYAFIHDFQVTDGRYVLIQNSVKLDLLPFLLGTKAPVQCVEFTPDTPARVHLIQRAPPGTFAERHLRLSPKPAAATVRSGRAGEGSVVVDVDPCFVFHLGSATEHAAGSGTAPGPAMTIDCIRYPEMPDFEDLMGHGAGFEYVRPEVQPKSELWRMEVTFGEDRSHGTDGGRLAGLPPSAKFRRITPRVMEFPCSAPQKGVPKYVYSAAALHPSLNMPQQALARIDMATGEVEAWSRGDRYYVGEPQFVTRAGADSEEDPDDGWLVAMCFDAARKASELVVLDAKRVAEGPVAVCRLRSPVPHGLHGHWAPFATEE